ncbi:hypothetical protein DRE_05213 [Drechslerella stenobrocha 248]|uniref:Uncharacterized protein n=1 Tax=Drechslerella stenobrocha 248 TaxID=1043628 RepID=W7HZK7_9PEZI|nr:hypothetical protein DRE_05213 [Drechslerella stenobrocha 248]
MRTVSLRQVASCFLLFAVAVHSHPKGPRAAKASIEERGTGGPPSDFQSEPFEKRAPVALESGDIEDIKARDASVGGLQQRDAAVGSEFTSLKERNVFPEGVSAEEKQPEKRTAKPYAVEKTFEEEFDLLDDTDDSGEIPIVPDLLGSPTEPSGEEGHQFERRSPPRPLSPERERERRNEHNAKVRRENIKRLYQEVSEFQEYRNTIPPSAYAADDGSFGHSISHRDLGPEAATQDKRAVGDMKEYRDYKRAVIVARLRELGYDPAKLPGYIDDLVNYPDPADQPDAPSEKRAEPQLEKRTKDDGSDDAPMAGKVEKRDSGVSVLCPSLRTMNSGSLIFFNPHSFEQSMAIFRRSCFNCACSAEYKGWYMIPDEDSGCTPRLVQNCYLAGCLCTEGAFQSQKMLVPKPLWRGEDKGESNYDMEAYDPALNDVHVNPLEAGADNEVLLRKKKRGLEDEGAREGFEGSDEGLDFHFGSVGDS